MRALVTGATGFIGRRLVASLEAPVVLTRRPEHARAILGKVEAFAWDPMSGLPPAEAFHGVEVVFHLAGEPIAEGRWTRERKQQIRESRVIGTRNLVKGIEAASPRPRVLVSSSAIGYYGSRGDEVLVESAAPGKDFLAEVCRAWEGEAQRAAALGVRVVTPRTGMVLGRGGALARMLTPFKLGLGGRLADGNQWMSWIHLDDFVGLLRHAAGRTEISGALNAVGPAPVRNSEFTRALARVLHRPVIFPVPEFALRVMFGELASVLLASQRVEPRIAQATGYKYRFAAIEDALRDAVS